jgi:PHS family inorganic phosphate transporter-like MFS transporter
LADPKSDARASDVKASSGFVALYCLAIFFCNFGPNVTTFVIAAEVFPTRYRSTAHGISAAVGKLGAISAQCLVSVLSQVHVKDSDPRHALTTL